MIENLNDQIIISYKLISDTDNSKKSWLIYYNKCTKKQFNKLKLDDKQIEERYFNRRDLGDYTTPCELFRRINISG